ncbi:MAG TPA: hypothetical protein VMW36_03840 [Patescibacteria group bacterium]|nr:hypothetical protein [Patescibacteria group bacterium]
MSIEKRLLQFHDDFFLLGSTQLFSFIETLDHDVAHAFATQAAAVIEAQIEGYPLHLTFADGSNHETEAADFDTEAALVNYDHFVASGGKPKSRESLIGLVIDLRLWLKEYKFDQSIGIAPSEKICWTGTEPMLVALFDELARRSLIDDATIRKRYKMIELHFLNKNYKPYKADQLAAVSSQKIRISKHRDEAADIANEASAKAGVMSNRSE